MTNFNFLSKSSSQSMGLSSVTLALTVGSPSAHRRGTMLKLISVLVLILTIGVGNVWGNATVALTTSNSNLSSSGITVNSNISISFGEGTYNSLPSVGSTYTKIYAGNTITFTPTNATITQVVMTASSNDYIKTWTKSAGTSISVNQKTATWTGSQTSAFTITNSASGQARITQIAITYTVNASYTVTWTIDPAAGGTLSATSGTSTTVTPNSAYTYGTPAYTVTSGGATVSQSTNTFTATPSANCTIRINMVEKPKYKITYNAGTGSCATTSWTQTVADESTTLPSATTTCSGWTFAGWCTSSAGSDDENSTSPGSILTGSYKPTSDVTLYAVYTRSASGAVTPASITITPASFSGLGSSNYGSGAERTGSQSGISLGGHYITANNANKTNGWSGGEYIQMQNGNGNLYNKTAFSGAITKIVVNQYAASTINLYCGNGNSQLIASNNTNTGQTPSGTLITKPDNSTSMEWTMAANNNYKYFDIKAGATNYISSIVVTYNAAGSSTTYYMTSLVCCTPLGSINGSFS